MFRPLAALATLATILPLLGACSTDAVVSGSSSTPTGPVQVTPTPTVNIKADEVVAWNTTATEFVARMKVPAPLPPTNESIIYAMVNGAMHDAVNAMAPRYQPYAYVGQPRFSGTGVVIPTVEQMAMVNAAIATAAYTILEDVGTRAANDTSNPNPVPLAYAKARYAGVMYLQSRNSDADAKVGAAIGRAAAVAMLATRTSDGVAGQGLAPLVSPGMPGAYRPTPPFTASITNVSGLADGQHWANVRPFVIKSADQFRPSAPYGASSVSEAVTTARYSADFNEVKALGGAISTRTPEQTDIAFFWMENSPLGWSRVARTLALSHSLDANDAAHLFAILSFAEADAYISAFDAKYTFNFWRPITAIRLADDDGNPETLGDDTWDVASSVIGVPTPPIPDYSSGHATAGGAAAAVIEALVPGSTAFTMESSSLPGKPRSFSSVQQAAAENAESRVFIGYHFRMATEVGLQQGREVGQFVLAQTKALQAQDR